MTMTMPMMICKGRPTLMYSMNVYCPAFMTRALGGVENGEAKHMLAATATAKSMGTGLTPAARAEERAMGDMRTAVAVLEMNMVSSEVVK